MSTRLAYTAVAEAIQTTLEAAGLTGSPQIGTNFAETDGYPRVMIDVGAGDPNDAHDGNGEIVPVDIHAYTASGSPDSAAVLLDEIKQALTDIDYMTDPVWPITFDTNDYLICTDAASNDEFDIDETAEFSVAFRITPTSVSGTLTILQKYAITPSIIGFIVRTSGDKLQLYVRKQGVSSSTMSSSAGALTAGVEQHCVITYELDEANIPTARFYVDGVAAGSYTASAAVGSLVNTSADVYVGYPTSGFVGSIWDIRFWNDIVLDSTDVAAEAANIDYLAVASETPTWGAGFRPGSGTSITNTWGSAVFSFADSPYDAAWSAPNTQSRLTYGEGGHVMYDGGDRITREPDGRHCNGVVRFRVWVDQLDA